MRLISHKDVSKCFFFPLLLGLCVYFGLYTRTYSRGQTVCLFFGIMVNFDFGKVVVKYYTWLLFHYCVRD